MSNQTQIILESKIQDLEKRVQVIELIVLNNKGHTPGTLKRITLAELARKEDLKKANGQQKMAAIVGFYEKILGQQSATPSEIKSGWKTGKFAGKYNPSLLRRAVGDLIRNLDDGSYDLTQKGEDFFQNLIG